MHTSSVFPLMCEGRLQGVCSNGAEVSIRLPDGSRSFGSRQAWGNCSPWPWSISPPPPVCRQKPTPNSSLRPSYKRQCKRCTQLAHFFVITFLSDILVFNICICAIKDILWLACLFVMFVTRPHATWQYIWHFQYFSSCTLFTDYIKVVLVSDTFQLWNMLSFCICICSDCALKVM